MRLIMNESPDLKPEINSIKPKINDSIDINADSSPLKQEVNSNKRKIYDSTEGDASDSPPSKKKQEDRDTKAEDDKPSTSISTKKQKQKEMSEKFRYGNFHRYYGNRLKGLQRDPRLDIFKKEWFQRRNILDIGCNAGYLTLSVAKEFEPAWILGIDIDEHLVGVARANIRHYCDEKEMIGKFPASLAVKEEDGGPKVKKFPNNVWFRRQNYVCIMDEEIEQTQEEYDIILALSITKWVHLNWGDDGIKRFFRRAFKNLRPGGRLIVEPQDFITYWKRAKTVDELRENYKKIEFKPEQFKDYLLNEIGFVSFEELSIPQANSKGFERPLQVFRKEVFKRLKKPKNDS
uniref:RNA methyltransferase n=1 Tax=Panagrolaimus sp. PS1159 TaxID=55785 RepID=A0AC35GNW5_9BILA